MSINFADCHFAVLSGSDFFARPFCQLALSPCEAILPHLKVHRMKFSNLTLRFVDNRFYVLCLLFPSRSNLWHIFSVCVFFFIMLSIYLLTKQLYTYMCFMYMHACVCVSVSCVRTHLYKYREKMDRLMCFVFFFSLRNIRKNCAHKNRRIIEAREKEK